MSKNLVVVGIGSSAGGLEALQVVLSSLGNIDNCAFIIAQHLSPAHKSMMTDLLKKVTKTPVIEAKNALKIKKNTIYMTPENTDIYVKKGKIYLKSIEQSFGPKPSVNYLFSSLATDFKDKAIGIVLSGTGTDGAFGIRFIKAEGGITIAQAPKTAKYDGMPVAAIDTGKVDLVISIENLGQEISRIVQDMQDNEGTRLNEKALQDIYKLLYEETNVDFSLYKRTTVIRRIERRLATLKIKSLEEYVNELKRSNKEIHNLYHDILIGVTSFFRDKEAFAVLEQNIQSLLLKNESKKEIRLWSIGCSTGEEAYSLAIILSELLQDTISQYKIKIFATDIDDESLKIARNAIYSEASLEGLTKPLIQRYFSIHKNQFEVKKSIREMVVFSKHNVVSDSPFLHIDLITCRNVLIYFNQALQNKFFPIVHYSLSDNGYLFLGQSESIGEFTDLFVCVDKKAKLYKSQYVGAKKKPKFYTPHLQFKEHEVEHKNHRQNEEELLEEGITQTFRQLILKNCVVINSSNDLVYIKGDIPYLKHSQGCVTHNIFKLLDNELSLDLRSSLNSCSKSKDTQYTSYRLIHVIDDVYHYVRMIVAPYQNDRNDDWMYIIFFHTEEKQNAVNGNVAIANNDEIVQELSVELGNTKLHLQSVIEELEASYEETQSLNEELQSSNEELQSSNEELETTNEELQSTNEELQTAYSELRVLYDDKEKRAKQLEELTQKLNTKTQDSRREKEITESVLDCIPIAIMMIDLNGKIKFINAFAENLFGMSKKQLINQHHFMEEWELQKLNGEALSESQTPFSLVKNSYESVFDINFSMIKQNKRLYLTSSGAPIFDVEGKFQGAAFYVEVLKFKENNPFSKGTDPIQGGDFYALYNLSLLDLGVNLKNDLNYISIQTKLLELEHSEAEKESENILDTIELISSKIDRKIDFYLSGLKYEKGSFNRKLKELYQMFESLFINNNIVFNLNIDDTVERYLVLKEDIFIIYRLLDSCLSLKQKCDSLGKFEIYLSNEFDEHRNYCIKLKIVHSDCFYSQEEIMAFMKERFSQNSVKLHDNTLELIVVLADVQ